MLTLLWKGKFYDHPSHKEVATLLLETRMQQQFFILTHKSTSSKLTLTPSAVRVCYVGINDDEDNSMADTEMSRTAALEEKLEDALHRLHIDESAASRPT